MRKRIDRIGDVYGKLLVIERGANDKHNKTTWICRCECENITTVTANNLANGHTTSCGCVWTKHGYSPKEGRTPTYNTWHAMKGRCTIPSTNGYEYYGGRGVSFCEQWKDFKVFLKDMGERPEGMTLDRKDPYGNYEPSNCRWADGSTQNLNKRK